MPTDEYEQRLRDALHRCADGDKAGLATLYDETIWWVYPLATEAAHGTVRTDDLVLALYARLWSRSEAFCIENLCPVAWMLRTLGRQVAGCTG